MEVYYQSQLSTEETQNQKPSYNNNQNQININNNNIINRQSHSDDKCCDFIDELLDCFNDCFQAFKNNCIPDRNCRLLGEDIGIYNMPDCNGCDCFNGQDGCCNGCDCSNLLDGCCNIGCHGCDCQCDGGCHGVDCICI
ncbi:hypothetical protein ABPG72_022578 [Tetrahymena utriculariae]